MKVPPSVCVDSVLDTELDREISAIVEQQPAPAAPPPPVLTRPRPIRHPGTSSSSPDQVMVAVVSTQQHSFQPGGTLPFHWIMEKVKYLNTLKIRECIKEYILVVHFQVWNKSIQKS